MLLYKNLNSIKVTNINENYSNFIVLIKVFWIARQNYGRSVIVAKRR